MAESYPRVAQVVLDITDARTLAEFYRQLFGLEYRAGDEPPAPNQPDPRGSDWLVLRNTHGGPQLAVQQTEGVRPSTWPDAAVSRMVHLDTVVRSTAGSRGSATRTSKACFVDEFPPRFDAAERRALASSARLGSANEVILASAPDGHAPDPEALVEALVDIDAHGSNQARGQRVLRRQLGILSIILLAMSVILVALLVDWLPAPQRQPSPSLPSDASSALSGLATDQLAVLAALFGAIGACMSSIQRATRRRTWERVPGLRVAMWASLTRPLVGAAAGLVEWALAAEGILGLLTFSFAAGFSERVILRFIPETPDTSGKPDEPGTEGNKGEQPKGETSS